MCVQGGNDGAQGLFHRDRHDALRALAPKLTFDRTLDNLTAIEDLHDQLERNVNICGFVSDERLAQLLKSSKIFVLPSHAEGFGLSVVEAMAAGLPCILSDLPALREYYSSTAIFVQRRNVESLANAILFLLSDPEKRAELRDKGKRLVGRFSWKEVALKEYSVLRSAVRCQEG
jgi:phosphatidylinositol alpha-mannosyltransferase